MTEQPSRTNVFTEAERTAIGEREWVGRLSLDFQKGVHVAQGTVVSLDVVVSLGIERERHSTAVAVHHVLDRIQPHLSGPYKGRTPPAVTELVEAALALPEAKAEEARRRKEIESSEAIGPIWLYVRQAGLVRAWASLEALAEDLWVFALNNAGRRLRQQAFQRVASLADAGGLGRKQVGIDVLAKYDFNLQEKVGTVLAEKFSFKTTDGIIAAFDAAFGWDKRNPAPTFPDAAALKAVEAKRHVIVHRGGTIDVEYATAAKADPQLIGTPLEMDGDDAVRDINVILVQGAKLLGATAVWLSAVDPRQL